VRRRGAVAPEAVAKAKEAGLDDAEIVETIANVAINIFTNYLNIVADTEIDFPIVRAAELATA
jgi:alkylhydroperoxidase family enzyme